MLEHRHDLDLDARQLAQLVPVGQRSEPAEGRRQLMWNVGRLVSIRLLVCPREVIERGDRRRGPAGVPPRLVHVQGVQRPRDLLAA